MERAVARLRCLAWLLAAGCILPTTAWAQTLEPCDATWLDAVRLEAVLRVEVTALHPTRYQGTHLSIASCTEETARLDVRWPDAHTESWSARLDTVAPEARTRLLALMLVELLRLGPRSHLGEGATPEQVSLGLSPAPTDGSQADPEPDPEPDAQPGPEQNESREDAPMDPSEAASPLAEPRSEAAGQDVSTAPEGGGDPRERPQEVDAWDLGADAGIRWYVARATLGPTWRVHTRYRRLLLDARMMLASRSGGIGDAEMVTASAGGGVRLLQLGSASFDVRAEVGYVEIQGFSATPEFAGRTVTAMSVGGFASLHVDLPLGPLDLSGDLEIGWQRGVAIEEDGRSMGGIDGPAVGLTVGLMLGT